VVSIDRVLSHFDAVKRTGRGWRVRCPAHADRNPSLDIDVARDGSVLFYCRSGQCEFGQIVEKAGLQDLKPFLMGRRVHVGASSWGDVPVGQVEGRTYSTTEIREGAPWQRHGLRVQAVYEYDDAQGLTMFLVVRLVDEAGNKSFRQCRAVGFDRWRLGLERLQTVIYRLPRVRRAVAEGAPVFICEGEKDVQTLELLGLSATTNPMGAGKWRESHSQSLKGVSRVVLFPDNDEPGRLHMASVAESLQRVGISVQMVDLPGLPEKGDVTDWVALGGTREELETLIERAGVLPVAIETCAADVEGRGPGLARPMPFPLLALPDSLAAFVSDAAAAFQCPVDYLAVPVMAVASAAIGASRAIRLRSGWVEACRLFAAIVAPPGSTKTPALGLVMRPYHEFQMQCDEVYRQERKAFDADMALLEGERGRKGSQRELRQDLEAPVHRCLLTSDATREALGDLLSKSNRGVLLYADELTGWVAGLNQYRGGRGNDRQFFLSVWSGQPIYVHRKSSLPVHVYNPFLSVIGCIPPDMLPLLADGRGREDGFLHRILFAYPEPLEPGAWAEVELSDNVIDGWRQTVRRLHELESDPAEGAVVLDLTDCGKRTWVLLFNEHRKRRAGGDLAPQMMGPLAKMESYAARLALVVHLLREACGERVDGIDEQSVAAGWALVDYFAAHAERIYPRVQADPEDQRVAQVVDWVRRRGGRCTARDLLTYEVASVKRAADAVRLMHDVVERGWAQLVERKAANGRGVTHLVLAKG
jgi:hypothetical protein